MRSRIEQNLVLPSASEWATLLRPAADVVRLVELRSCSARAPEVQDEYASAAEVTWLPFEIEPDATRALGLIVKRLLCCRGEWPAAEAWDDETVAIQAQECLSRFGAGTLGPANIAVVLERAGSVQRAIAVTRARAGQLPPRAMWPRAPLVEVYALKDEWNDMFYFGRTGADWSCFSWATTV